MDVPVKKATAASALRPGKTEVKPTTLLDVHEVEWITWELKRLLAREQQSGGDVAGADGGRHQRKRDKVSPAPKKGGFLGRHAISICSGDAVDSAVAGVDGGRWPRGRGSFREVEKV